MPPSLVDKWGASLPPLAPKSVEPADLVARRTALRELKTIRMIRTLRSQKVTKVRRYEVEVFTRSVSARTSTSSWGSTLLPTGIEEISSQHDDDRQQRPSVRVEKEVWEFVDLRDSLYNIARSAHHDTYCEFCSAAMEVLVLGVNPGGIFFHLLGDARVARKLTTFMTDFLDRTLQIEMETGSCCPSQTLSLQVVHEFLFIPTSPTSDEPESCNL